MKNFIFLILFLCHLAYAQSDFRFKKLSIDQGLSQSTVETILQDRSGFMWFGTEDGLNRYDGYQFRIFKHDPDDSASISNNNVWCLYEDSTGHLWIGTFSGGLNRFDPQKETFTRYVHNPADAKSISSNNIRTISGDRNGMIWVGTRGGGINRFNLHKNSFEPWINDADIQKFLAGINIRHIYQDAADNLWIATNKGLQIYDQSQRVMIPFENKSNVIGRLSSQNIRHVFQDRSGIFWISTLNGLNRFNPATRKISQFLSESNNPPGIISSNINEVFEDRSARLWIAGHKDGLIIFDRSANSFTTSRYDELNDHSLSSNSLRNIYEDRGGLVWIGTLGGGINIFDPGTARFRHYHSEPGNRNSLSNSIIWSIAQSRDGDIWFATNKGGLNRFNRQSGKYIYYQHDPADPYSISTNDLRAVMEDSQGKIWVATQNGGVNQLDPAGAHFIRYRHDPQDNASLSSDNVREIFEDRSGNLWISTWGGGLDLYNPRSDTFTHFSHQPDIENSLSSNNVIAVFQDRGDIYWVATMDGLNKMTFAPESLTNNSLHRSKPGFLRFQHNPADPNSISNNYVLSIYQAQNGDLWFGTMLGLNRMKYDQKNKALFERFLIKDGLPNDIIYGILEDGQGNIWCSTNKGLSKFSVQDRVFRNYDTNDGLHGNEFNTGAYLKTNEGSMIFGGVDGATEFFPDELMDNPYEAPVVLTGFYIFDQPGNLGRSVTGIEEITLSYKDNYFSFDFAALDFSKPERNRYAYMLDGLDPGWVNSGTRRFAGYTQLDPGAYIFKVKGTNGDGVWNETGTSVRIIITPPFWKTGWFIALVILATGGGITLLITYRVKQLLAIERLRSKIAADLHDDIGAGLTEISIMGEVIAQKLPDRSRQSVHSELQKIGNTARGLIDSMSHIVWLVNPKRDSLFDLISRLGDTYTELLDATDIQFRTQNLDALKKVHLKMEHRQQLFLIFHEAINNSVKYSQGTEITLNSSLKGKKLILQLTDNGRGFNVEQVASGDGLKNMHERARRIGGRLSIYSDKTGTKIEFVGNIS